METNIEQKILRFIELSREFISQPKDLYDNLVSTNTISVSEVDRSYLLYNASFSNSYNEPSPTQLELLKRSLDAKYEKAQRWEEFVGLRNDLNSYFSAKNKLNN